MRVLVTGGAGYIGSHTAKLLAASGHSPIVFDDMSQGHDWAVKWGPIEHGSLSDTRSPARRVRASPDRRRHSLRRQRTRRRVDEQSGEVLPEQHRRHAESARRHARRLASIASSSRPPVRPTATPCVCRSTRCTRRRPSTRTASRS